MAYSTAERRNYDSAHDQFSTAFDWKRKFSKKIRLGSEWLTGAHMPGQNGEAVRYTDARWQTTGSPWSDTGFQNSYVASQITTNWAKVQIQKARSRSRTQCVQMLKMPLPLARATLVDTLLLLDGYLTPSFNFSLWHRPFRRKCGTKYRLQPKREKEPSGFRTSVTNESQEQEICRPRQLTNGFEFLRNHDLESTKPAPLTSYWSRECTGDSYGTPAAQHLYFPALVREERRVLTSGGDFREQRRDNGADVHERSLKPRSLRL